MALSRRPPPRRPTRRERLGCPEQMARRGMLTSSTPHLLRDSIKKVVTKREGIAGLENDGVNVRTLHASSARERVEGSNPCL